MTLTPERALVLAAYLLVANGLAALWIGGVLGALGIALVVPFVVLSLWQEQLRLGRGWRGDTVPGLVAAAALALDVAYVAESVLDALVHLLLFLLLYRLFTRRSARDVRDIGFLAFLMLVASAPGTFGLGFLGVFVGFVLLATWALVLRQVLVDAESPVSPAPGSGMGAPGIAASRLFALSAAAAAGTLLLTATLFFVIPRIGHATLPLRMKVSRMVSGFSEHVSLGAFGEIETDSGVAMRVYVPEGPLEPEGLPGLRWRGIVLDHFDGDTWTREDGERRILRPSMRGTVDVARPRGGGIILTQEIYLEPLGTETLFAAPRALRLAARAPAISVDGGGSLSSRGAGSARVTYTVDSELESVPPRRLPARASLTADERARYLQLPPLAGRVQDLARLVAADAPDALTAASRLSAYLATRYRYSLALERQTTLPPVEEFLFVSRTGNCEYFAASLAVMLRSVGIPARVVNGFQRGEWNPFGRYFIVRLLDAHSWVEAHAPEVGWVTLDPSPRSGLGRPGGPSPFSLYLDALRLRWYRYVVNWSLQDQVAAAGRVRQAARTWTPAIPWTGRFEDLRALAVAGAVALTLLAVVLLVRHAGRPSARPGGRGGPPRFYSRTLRVLRRRGFEPAPAETAREFASRVGRAWPASVPLLDRITGAYERVRFGGSALTPTELEAVESCLAGIAAADDSP